MKFSRSNAQHHSTTDMYNVHVVNGHFSGTLIYDRDKLVCSEQVHVKLEVLFVNGKTIIFLEFEVILKEKHVYYRLT